MLPNDLPADIRDRAARIKLAVFDVDGVLTDGKLVYAADGHEIKAFHVHDGLGFKRLLANGIEVAIISGRASPALRHRADNLGITHCLIGVRDKGAAIEQLAQTLGIRPDQCAVMGDDVIDLPMLNRAGVSVTVSDAPSLIRARVDWVTHLGGGQGAVRELIDLLIDARGAWSTVLADYQ